MRSGEFWTLRCRVANNRHAKNTISVFHMVANPGQRVYFCSVQVVGG